MRDRDAGESRRPEDDGLVRGVVTIVVVGVVLGVAFNWLGLASRPAWGIPWIGEDRLAGLEELDDVVAPRVAPASVGGYTDISDPMAVGLGGGSEDLPEVPELDRPVEIRLEAVKRLFDAGAAVIVDAREPDEYAAGHIAGALSLPFDEATAEPERLEGLRVGGRPIVTYCGGGTCEVSLGLAWELIAAGQTRVVVYVGGYGEWAEAGYPVEQGPPPGS
jgi:rhodanese-related sulfurtransferase